MSTQDDLNELRRQATLSIHENSPAILRVGEDAPEAQGKDELVSEHPIETDHHDWQLVDDRCISQCGSSPRCLSHVDLEHPEEATTPPPSAPPTPLETPQPTLDGSHEASEAASDADTHTDDLNDGQHLLESEPDSEAQDTKEEVPQDSPIPSEPSTQEEDEDVEEAPERAASGTLLSGQSSYADVSMSATPPEMSDEEEGDSTDGEQPPQLPESQPAADGAATEPALSEQEQLPAEIASSEDFEGVTSESDAQSQPPAEQETPPASVAPSMSFGSELAESDAASDRLDFTDGEGMPDGPSLYPSSFGSGSASPRGPTTPATHFTRRLRQAATTGPPPPPPASYWQQWLQQAGATRAGKLLRQLWARLQAQAARAGAVLPWEWRARIHRLLANLERRVAPHLEDTKTLMLVSGLAVVSALLAYTYCRNCSLTKALKASDAALNEHFITILELNAKLKNSVDIPITRHCGFKSSLALSHSVF